MRKQHDNMSSLEDGLGNRKRTKQPQRTFTFLFWLGLVLFCVGVLVYYHFSSATKHKVSRTSPNGLGSINLPNVDDVEQSSDLADEQTLHSDNVDEPANKDAQDKLVSSAHGTPSVVATATQASVESDAADAAKLQAKKKSEFAKLTSDLSNTSDKVLYEKWKELATDDTDCHLVPWGQKYNVKVQDGYALKYMNCKSSNPTILSVWAGMNRPVEGADGKETIGTSGKLMVVTKPSEGVFSLKDVTKWLPAVAKPSLEEMFKSL